MAGGLRGILADSFQGAAMGVMDGTITVLGIVMGVGAATGDARLVVISGLVGGISNSIGTSVGFYTSENAERGQQIQFYEKNDTRKKLGSDHKYIHAHGEILMSAFFGFLAAVVALVLPIAPFFFGLPISVSMAACFIIAMAMLFSLGVYIGKANRAGELASGIKYALIGMLSSLVAFAVGEGLKLFLVLGVPGG